jgi:pyridoxamine 5'-phosphate oxidase
VSGFDSRVEYGRGSLDVTTVDPDPIRQFERWFAEAQEASVQEPNAMTLATATPDGVPSARVVLLKGVDPGGFVFFTDYRSRKGTELAANPEAALVFFWQPLERQVRVVGPVGRTSPEESARYFGSRPEGSRLGAWSSVQSSVLSGRDQLEAAVARTKERFEGREIVCPPHWGGFRLSPRTVEFWQGRASRLHDRILYRRENDRWVIERLAP